MWWIVYLITCYISPKLFLTSTKENSTPTFVWIVMKCDVYGQYFLTIGNCHDAQLKSAWLRNGVNSQMRKVWSLWKIVFLTAAKMPNKKVLGFGMVCGQHVTFGQHCFCVSLLYFTKIILNIHKTRVHTCIFVYCDKVWCLWPMFFLTIVTMYNQKVHICFFGNCHNAQLKSAWLRNGLNSQMR